jgi:hypothetical protein
MTPGSQPHEQVTHK